MTFDVNSYENKGFSFKEIPNGTYKVILESSALTDSIDKETGKVKGNYYKCIFVIVEGEFEKQKIFINYTKSNLNEQAIAISISQLRALSKLVASQNTNDTQLRMLCKMIYENKFTSQDNYFAEIMEKGKIEQKPFSVEVFGRKGKQYTDYKTGEVKDGSLSYALNLGPDVEKSADEVLQKYVGSATTKKTEAEEDKIDDSIPY